MQEHTNKSNSVWGIDEANFLKKCKQNIIKGNSSHFGSTGKYYSFGNRANYALIDNSSVTQYVSKKFKSDVKTKVAQLDAEYMEFFLVES